MFVFHDSESDIPSEIFHDIVLLLQQVICHEPFLEKLSFIIFR